MSVQTQQIHRRKSSKDAEEIRITTTTPTIEVRVPKENKMPSVMLSPPRLVPSPHHLGHGRTPVLTPAPYRTSFGSRGLASLRILRSTFSYPFRLLFHLCSQRRFRQFTILHYLQQRPTHRTCLHLCTRPAAARRRRTRASKS